MDKWRNIVELVAQRSIDFTKTICADQNDPDPPHNSQPDRILMAEKIAQQTACDDERKIGRGQPPLGQDKDAASDNAE